MRTAEDKVGNAAKSARDTVQNELRVLDLRSEDIKDELARTGQVVRRKAREAGQAIADATADARTTAAIKARLVASRDLSALNISVNTTAGVVTLSGTVSSPEHIGKAMLLAMETQGVREVVSTLQVNPKPR
jgi:osmotically-inducible protein OsmY